MKRITTYVLVWLAIASMHGQNCPPFELIDLHVHLKGDLTIEEAIKKSGSENIKYGIAANCGLGFPIENDSAANAYFDYMKGYPQFYIGMQAEGREWLTLFSKETISKFDYVFTDAMTFTDAKGRRNRIWIEEETWIDDEQAFMDFLVNTIVQILENEPIQIYANPTYLPQQLADRYHYLWTEERMDKVISAAKIHDIAIEINPRFRIPSVQFITKAKNAGLKFTIGSNNIDKNFEYPQFAIDIINTCGLTESDFWVPQKR
jgi:hypothetical protein